MMSYAGIGERGSGRHARSSLHALVCRLSTESQPAEGLLGPAGEHGAEAR